MVRIGYWAHTCDSRNATRGNAGGEVEGTNEFRCVEEGNEKREDEEEIK